MVEPRVSPARRVLPAAVLAVGGLATAVAAIGGFATRQDAAELDAKADAVEIIRLRSELRRVQIHETNTVLLGIYGMSESADIDAARDARASARSSARERAEELAQGSSPAAAEARFLIELLRTDGLDGVREADPNALLESAHAAVHDGRGPAESYDDATLALYDLMLADIAGALVVNDALDAAYVIEQPDVPEALLEYVSNAGAYLSTEGGYLGPDPETPIEQSFVYRASARMPHPRLAEVNAVIASGRLWDYDQWIRSWQFGVPTVAAPMLLSDLVVQAQLVDGNTRGIIDTTLSDTRHELRESASATSMRGVVLLALATLFGLLSIVPLVGLVRAIKRGARHAEVDVGRDALTSAGSRLILDQDVAPALQDPSLGWHLIATIDIERLALINETWGRQAGDRVLVEVARALSEVVDELESSDDILRGSVVRVGGDEFLVAMHSVEPMELEVVRSMLSEVASMSIPILTEGEYDPHHDGPMNDTAVDGSGADGTGVDGTAHVSPMFRLGIATSTQPTELEDLVRAADLAARNEQLVEASASGDTAPANTHV